LTNLFLGSSTEAVI